MIEFNPISVLSSQEMLSGFNIDIKEQEKIVDIGGGLSMLWSLTTQQYGKEYVSIDPIYNKSKRQLTSVLMQSINPLIEKHWGYTNRLESLQLKLRELAQIMSNHPYIDAQVLNINSTSVEHRINLMKDHIKRQFKNIESLIVNNQDYLDFIILEIYGSSKKDSIRSKKWIHELAKNISWSRIKFVNFFGKEAIKLHDAYTSSPSVRYEVINKSKTLREMDIFFYEQLYENLMNKSVKYHSNAQFIGSTIELDSYETLSNASTILCNFVLNGKSKKEQKELLSQIQSKANSSADICISIPKQDTSTSQMLMDNGAYEIKDVIYRKGNSEELKRIIESI